MKVVFYLLDGDTNASSRHRVLQYLPFLRQHGIQPYISRPLPKRLDETWGRRAGGLPKAAFYGAFVANRLRDVLQADRFDVAVIQRDLFPFGPPWLERLLWQRNPRLVYDTDDATYIRPSFTPDTVFQHLRAWSKPVEVVRHARWVSAATEPIAAWAREFNPHVSVVPMALDLAEYPLSPRATAGPVTLGWTGTPGGLRYLESLAPVLRDLATRHSFTLRIISGASPSIHMPGLTLDVRPWRADSIQRDLAEIDIGLVPLADAPFERAKFPFKLLQYMALGIPAVCARVGVAAEVIADGENGLLAASPDMWRDALERLIGDRSLRQRLGRAGRQTVEQRYTVERVAPLVLDVLSAAAGV